MNNQHPWQLKKSKSWRPFWSYQLKCTANSAPFAHFRGKWAGLAPRFLIFSIAMGANYLFELNSIETYAPQYFGHNNLVLGIVKGILHQENFRTKSLGRDVGRSKILKGRGRIVLRFFFSKNVYIFCEKQFVENIHLSHIH